MATKATQSWVYAQQIDEKLKAALVNEKSLPSYQEVEQLIQEMRKACEETIFLDFEYAVRKSVEKRLWDGHIVINNRYRKMLEPYRKSPEKKHKVVERRGVEKHYVDFLKTSQFFYRNYIQRLASHFAGLRKLRRIANCLQLEVTYLEDRVQVNEEVAKMIETSCHSTLLRLGDLSRYRNQVRTKDRSWAPAMGYYALANDLCPDNGCAQNQMAVIALADGNHLDAIYHLFRAIAILEPHPLAEENLDKKLEKVRTTAKTRRPQQDSVSTLIWWFVLLQAYFHEGKEFSVCAELEKEVLSRLAKYLKEEAAAAGMLERFVIISIAAEAFAAKRVSDQVELLEKATEEAKNAYYFSLGFNIQMMIVLLKVISPELDQDPDREELPQTVNDGTEKLRDKITAVARRILPALRLYSTWLAGSKLIIMKLPVLAVKVHGSELWKMYAHVLTKLVNLFSIADLPTVEYLLEEDEGIVGFSPLRNPNLPIECDLFTDMEGKAKVQSTEPGVQRFHPNKEMQARIRDILLTAASMETKKEIPIICHEENGRHIFTVDETALAGSRSPQIVATPPQEIPQASPPWPSSGNFSPQKCGQDNYPVRYDENALGIDGMDSIDNDPQAGHMVDSLLEPNETSYGMSTSPHETSYGMHTATVNDLLASRPSFFSLENSIFAPRPHELQATSPNRSLFHHTSPLSLSTKENRAAAAALLDEITRPSPPNSGFGSGFGPWGRSASKPLSGSVKAPVNQVLQESLAQQYQASYSSAFTNSSSVYGNSSQDRNRLGGGANWGVPVANGNSTIYPGASDFDRTTMLQSSIWNGGEPNMDKYASTPPGGQGG